MAKNRRVSFGNLEGSKLPPQETELEEAVLGALLIENCFDTIADILNEKCFYKDAHGIIFKAIAALKKESQPIDILTVTAWLRKKGELELVGGSFAITQLTNRVASSANLEYHARLIAEAYLGREVIRISGEYQSRAFTNEEDIFDLMDEMHKEIDAIRNFGIDGNDIPLSIEIDERVKEKEKLVKDGVTFTGITTGSKKLDSITGGWVKQNLIIIAARPAMGKSVKALQYSKIAAQSGKGVLFFSLEMSKQELIDRFLVEESRIFLHDYRSNKLTEYDLERMRNSARNLKKLPIVIYDTPAINCSYIERKSKQYNKNHELGLIVVDYLQLMTAETKVNSRELEVGQVSRGLKAIAKKLDVPLIALAQVGRSAEQAKDKRPGLEHLRESGSIEADADVVMFLYRPSYYFKHGEHPDEEYSMENITSTDYEFASELLLGKNRNGVPNAKIKEKFYGHYSMFTSEDTQNLDPLEVEPQNSDLNIDTPF